MRSITQTKIHNAANTLMDALARRDFLSFCQRIYPGWITAPHHVVLADHLMQVMDGSLDRLMASLPPRHTKSLMFSILFPAFWLAHNPDKQIIHASYAASLSNDFSRQVRNIVRDDLIYKRLFPHMGLDPDRQRLDDWKTTQGGGFKSVGVTAGITGHGADLFIIDDPHKEGDEKSMTQLLAVFDWYNSAARTRLSPGAPVLFPMTRWHPRDLAGRLLEMAEIDSNADQWLQLKFPALALENDPLGRSPGDPLWPERFTKENLLSIQALSERYFEALFQQNPQVTDEPMFLSHLFKREWINETSLLDG